MKRVKQIACEMRFCMQSIHALSKTPEYWTRCLWKDQGKTKKDFEFLQDKEHLEAVNDLMKKNGYVVRFEEKGSFFGAKNEDVFGVFLANGHFEHKEKNVIKNQDVLYRFPAKEYLE